MSASIKKHSARTAITLVGNSRQKLFLIVLLITSAGCFQRDEPVSLSLGYKPVYSTDDPNIALESPREVREPGKISIYGKYLLVNEVNKGIHFFDNEDPSQPIALSFLKIPGNTEMAIRNDVLYANHLGNIVALTLLEDEVQTLASLPLHNTGDRLLPPEGYYFECIDPKRGAVVNWVMTERKNMDCYAIP
jgi:hypothetical protein